MDPNNPVTASQEAHEAVDDAIAAENHAAVDALETAVETATEHAEERVEAAETAAEAIADAALMTALGQRVEQMEGRVATWLDGEQSREDARENRMLVLEASMTALQAQMSAGTTGQTLTVAETPEGNLSIQPAPQEPLTVEPGTLETPTPEPAAEVVVPARKRKLRFL